MYRVSGKQRFGGVWANGKCIAVFIKGVAEVNDPEAAEILKAQGYTVEGEPTTVKPKTTSRKKAEQ